MSSYGALTPLDEHEQALDDSLMDARNNLAAATRVLEEKRIDNEKVQKLKRNQKGGGEGNKARFQKAYEQAVEVHQEALRQFEMATKAREGLIFSAEELDAGLQHVQDARNALNAPNGTPPQPEVEGVHTPTDEQAKEVQPVVEERREEQHTKELDGHGVEEQAGIHGVEEQASIHKQAAQHLTDKLEALRLAGNVTTVVPAAPVTVGGKRKGKHVGSNHSKKTKTGNEDAEDDISRGLKDIEDEAGSDEDLESPEQQHRALAEAIQENKTTAQDIATEAQRRLTQIPDLTFEDRMAMSIVHTDALHLVKVFDIMLKEHEKSKSENEKSESTAVKKRVLSEKSGNKRLNIEDRWVQSYTPDAQDLACYEPDGPEEWRAQLEVDAGKAMDVFLADNSKAIPSNLRRLMRTINEFAPRSGTTSRALTLHVLQTFKDTINCRFHNVGRGRVKTGEVDGYTPGKFVIVGVPYSSVSKPKNDDSIMSCGCEKDVALMEFFWWKTWTIKSANPGLAGVTEAMKSDWLDGRHRAFFYQAYTAGTMLGIDDLYPQGLEVYGSPSYDFRLKAMQAERFVAAANAGLKMLGQPLWVREKESAGRSLDQE